MPIDLTLIRRINTSLHGIVEFFGYTTDEIMKALKIIILVFTSDLCQDWKDLYCAHKSFMYVKEERD